MDLKYIRCSIDDLSELQQISKSTFSDTFKDKNDPDEFKSYMDYSFSKQKLTFELLNPNSKFYFVYLDEDMVGYFKLNFNDAQTENFDTRSAELERFYVIDKHQGRGIGQEMMKHIIDYIKRHSPEFLWLGVWQKNPRAIDFYEKQGFKKFDTHPYFIGRDRQIDWLMKLQTA